jgi:brefeldin A-resistance guanine nucleotide exchange factor 1
MIVCNTSTFDGAMFRLAWRPLISAIAYAFTMSAGDDHVIQKAITGFRQCASLASTFQLPEVFDTIVQSLAIATGLLEDASDIDKANITLPVVEKDGQSLTVSPLSIRETGGIRSSR